MSWFSVDEQLPPSEEDVLVYSPDDGCYRAWYDHGTWLSHENVSQANVTHWMNMPEKPRVAVPNGNASYGMTDKLITCNTRPYSVWSENVDTARDIKHAWESRFGGTYKIFKNNQGFQVKYMGKWTEDPLPQ